MTKPIYLILFSLVLSQVTAQNTKKDFESSITELDLQKHLSIIASDDFGGRNTGSEGQKKAADYIISQLIHSGIKPVVKDSTGNLGYLQKFNLYTSGWKDEYIRINGKKKFSFKDYFPEGLVNVPEEKTVETVFIGYGIKSKYRDDFKNLDLKDKAVVFFESLPAGYPSDDEYAKMSKFSLQAKKIRTASDLGAKYFFIISKSESSGFVTLAAERKAILGRFNQMSLNTIKSPSSSPDPSFTVSQSFASELLGLSEKKFKKLLKGKTTSFKSATITLKSERGGTPVESANIAGFIEGSDKKDEIIVVSAHYDHVGTDEKGRIYNGADDDGSGTCALLELAEAINKAKLAGQGPRRGILFLWVTGEEKGLLGSQYYTDKNPIFPLENTMCDLNIDMIGRVDKEHEKDPNYVYLIGSDKLSSDLHKISEEVNKNNQNLLLDYTYNSPTDPNRFYYRSDHYNFAKNKIPVIFYFTGVHEDYHQPGDDVEKIMFPKYTKIVKLVFNTLWELANIEERIKVDSNKP